MQQEKTYTRRQRLENWFYYHKLWVLIGLVILWVVGSMLWNVLGIGQTEPDVRILYVGSRQLPEDCVHSLCHDCRGHTPQGILPSSPESLNTWLSGRRRQ